VLVWEGKELIQERKKEFGTSQKELERLRFWLMACQGSEVAMESAGVYGKPVWHVLERQKQFPWKLVNAQPYHGVDGQKTDPMDASWLAEWRQCGLRKGSFVPPQWPREWRDLTRLRVSLRQDQNRVQNRIEKVLEDAHLKLGSVASNTLGTSGERCSTPWWSETKIPAGSPTMPRADCAPNARSGKRPFPVLSPIITALCGRCCSARSTTLTATLWN
jgi:transposase